MDSNLDRKKERDSLYSKNPLIRSVRKAFSEVYEMRKELVYGKATESVWLSEKTEKIISAVLNWPLVNHHCLRRFDELMWDLLEIYKYTKEHFNTELTWIQDFSWKYLNKCLHYYYSRLDFYEEKVETSTEIREILTMYINKFGESTSMRKVWKEWDENSNFIKDDEKQSSITYEQNRKIEDPDYELTVGDRFKLQKYRVNNFQRYKKKYEQQIDNYKIEFPKLIEKIIGNGNSN